MENTKIILENGVEQAVNGIFYIYNSKYYFIYTTGEFDEIGYVKLYVVQVCKEIKNTLTGPIDTGYMLGLEISDSQEWKNVQEAITKIVDDKKNGTHNAEIQYLPINMLVNLKIISTNKFKLMKQIVEDNFKVTLSSTVNDSIDVNTQNNINDQVSLEPTMQATQPIVPEQMVQVDQPLDLVETEQVESLGDLQTTDNNTSFTQESENNISDMENMNDVIIDYRARFFEEQEKNAMLEEQIKILNEKLENIKNIIG